MEQPEVSTPENGEIATPETENGGIDTMTHEMAPVDDEGNAIAVTETPNDQDSPEHPEDAPTDADKAVDDPDKAKDPDAELAKTRSHASAKINEIKKEAEMAKKEAKDYLDVYIDRIIEDPEEMVKIYKRNPEFADRLYKAMPDDIPAKMEALEKVREYEKVLQDGETDAQREQRIAREAEERALHTIKSTPEFQRLQKDEIKERERLMQDFQKRHELSDDKFKEIEDELAITFVGLQNAFSSKGIEKDRSELLDRALAAVSPELVKQEARKQALIESSDREAATLTGSASAGGKTATKYSPEQIAFAESVGETPDAIYGDAPLSTSH